MIKPVKNGNPIFRTIPGAALPRLRGVGPISSFPFVKDTGPIITKLFKDREIDIREIQLDGMARLMLLTMKPSLEKRVDAGKTIEEIFNALELSLFMTKDNILYILGDKDNITRLGDPSGRLILTPQEALAMSARKEMPPIGAMVKIPGGRYTLGDNNSTYDSEKPEHIIEVDPFLVGVYSITNGEYKLAADDGLYEQEKFWTAEGWQIKEKREGTKPVFWGDEDMERFNGGDQPVVGVSWLESFAYLIWQSVQEGIPVEDFLTGKFFDLSKIYDRTNQRWRWEGYRLPTEAEREIAARGGLVGRKYPWGNEEPTTKLAHFNLPGKTGAPVAVNDPYFAPNRYGLYHMAGNVWEWGWDWYDGDSYKELYKQQENFGAVKNPIGSKSGGGGRGRVLRGGSWNDAADRLPVVFRYNHVPDDQNAWSGFRAVRNIEEKPVKPEETAIEINSPARPDHPKLLWETVQRIKNFGPLFNKAFTTGPSTIAIVDPNPRNFTFEIENVITHTVRADFPREDLANEARFVPQSFQSGLKGEVDLLIVRPPEFTQEPSTSISCRILAEGIELLLPNKGKEIYSPLINDLSLSWEHVSQRCSIPQFWDREGIYPRVTEIYEITGLNLRQITEALLKVIEETQKKTEGDIDNEDTNPIQPITWDEEMLIGAPFRTEILEKKEAPLKRNPATLGAVRITILRLIEPGTENLNRLYAELEKKINAFTAQNPANSSLDQIEQALKEIKREIDQRGFKNIGLLHITFLIDDLKSIFGPDNGMISKLTDKLSGFVKSFEETQK